MGEFFKLNKIKGIKLFCTTALICLSGQAHAYSLQQSVRDAMGFNPQMRIEMLDRQVSEEDIQESRAAFYPTLSATAEAGRVSQNNDTTRALTSDSDNAQSNVAEGYVAVNQLLFDGNSTYNRYKAAKSRKTATEYDYNAAAIDVMRQAAATHIEVMRLRAIEGETQGFLNAVAKYRDNMSLMVNEGALGRSELLQADELIMLTRNALLTYQEQLVLAETLYEETVGQLPEPDLTVDDAAANALLPSDLAQALNYGRAHHPRLHSLDFTANALRRDADAEKNTIIPRFDAELSYRDRDQDNEVGGEAKSAQALVKMSWDMSLGGAYGARVDRNLHLQQQALAEKDQLMNYIERDIKQRYAELLMSGKQLKILTDRETANRDIFNSYNQEYEAGARSILEIVNSQNRMFDSTVSRVNGLYKNIAAKYDLLGAMGRIYEAFGYTTPQ